MLSLFLFLCGCAHGREPVDEVIDFRETLQGQAAEFSTKITVDYGDSIYDFSVFCAFDRNGDMTFQVLEPDSIENITGTVSSSGGALTFDDKVLAFEMIADGQITPIGAPWLLIKALRGGYIHSCGKSESGTVAQIDDSYADNAMALQVYFTEEMVPYFGEIMWNGRRILSVEIENFTFV